MLLPMPCVYSLLYPLKKTNSVAEFFADIFGWLAAMPPVLAYCVLLGIAFGENVVPPIPGDMLIVFGGYLAGIGQLNGVLVWTLATLGGTLGFMAMYALGRRMGHAVFESNRMRWLPREQLGNVRGWLQRWGYGVVAANRFLSGTRSIISLTVGMAGMDAGRTTFWAAVSAAVWTGLITWGGYAVGENWEVISDYLQVYGWIIISLMAVGALVFLLRNRYKKGASQKANRMKPDAGDDV